jgi:hypothetical protein
MCIIAIKDAGVQFPTIDTVETMCGNNPDGFAVVWHKAGDKHSRVYRTMNRESFLKRYKMIVRNYDYKTTSLYIHARIATHGSLKQSNCHGFVDHRTRLCFAHNGILGIKNRDDLTDSETFFRDYFIPVYRHGGWFEAEKLIKDTIGYSKFVFMDGDGRLRRFGNYIRDNAGVLYSNSSFRRHPYSYYLKG